MNFGSRFRILGSRSPSLPTFAGTVPFTDVQGTTPTRPDYPFSKGRRRRKSHTICKLRSPALTSILSPGERKTRQRQVRELRYPLVVSCCRSESRRRVFSVEAAVSTAHATRVPPQECLGLYPSDNRMRDAPRVIDSFYAASIMTKE